MSTVAEQIQALAPSYGVPANLAVAVATKESNLNQNAVGSSGEIGVFQLMPSTAASLGVNASDLTSNIQGGLTYLSQLYKQYGDWETALIAYNEGSGNLANKGVFSVSQSYADSILAAAGDLTGSSSSSSSDSSTSDFSLEASLSDLLGGSDLTVAGTDTGLSALAWGAIAAVFIGLLYLTSQDT